LKIKKLKLDKELIQAENRSIADHNLSKEPHLKQLREELDLKYKQLGNLKEVFQANQAKLGIVAEDFACKCTKAFVLPQDMLNKHVLV